MLFARKSRSRTPIPRIFPPISAISRNIPEPPRRPVASRQISPPPAVFPPSFRRAKPPKIYMTNCNTSNCHINFHNTSSRLRNVIFCLIFPFKTQYLVLKFVTTHRIGSFSAPKNAPYPKSQLRIGLRPQKSARERQTNSPARGGASACKIFAKARRAIRPGSPGSTTHTSEPRWNRDSGD